MSGVIVFLLICLGIAAVPVLIIFVAKRVSRIERSSSAQLTAPPVAKSLPHDFDVPFGAIVKIRTNDDESEMRGSDGTEHEPSKHAAPPDNLSSDEKSATRSKRQRAAFGRKWGGISICAVGIMIALTQRDASYNPDQPLLPVTGKLETSGRGANGGSNFDIRDNNGHHAASCNSEYCGYHGYDKDIGKQATFWMQGHDVFKIEVDGAVRVDEETIMRRKAGMKMFPIIFAIGGFLLFASAFLI